MELTDEIVKEIIYKYEVEKLSSQKIGKIFNLDASKIWTILVKNNIPRRQRNKRSHFNENYFEKINTEAKAYFLGFLLADGCIYEDPNPNKNRHWQKQMYLGLHVSDEDILKSFQAELELTKKLKYGNTRPSVILCLTSDKICNDLDKLGVTSRKSLTANFPNHELIPENLMNHFIRGLFDGDGCLSKTIQKNKNNIFSYRFDICGTLNVCLGVQRELNKVVIKEDENRKPYQQGKIYRQFYRKLQSLKLIYNYLYEDAHFFLKRKQNIFKQVFEVQVIRPKIYAREIIRPCDLPSTQEPNSENILHIQNLTPSILRDFEKQEILSF